MELGFRWNSVEEMKVNEEESEGAEFVLFQTEIEEMKETEVKKSEL